MKDNVKTMKRQATDWEKIFLYHTADKGHVSRKYKELLKLDNKKIINSIKK